ncbi:MAG: hypothetical protein ACQKBT_03500, partial [Puniceicoccales bacterium]
MKQLPKLNPSYNQENPPTREQMSELIRHRLIPADRVRLISSDQAEKLLQRHRRKRFKSKLAQTLVSIVLLVTVSVLGYFLYQNQFSGPVDYSVQTGDWGRYIRSEQHVLVLDKIPDHLREKLDEQNQILASLLKKSEKGNGPSIADRFLQLKSEFPSAYDIQHSYGERYKSVSGGTTQYGNYKTKGVQDAYVRRYEARVKQFTLHLLPEQLPATREALIRDIDDLSERIAKSSQSALSAQNQSSLVWLQGRLLPYLDRFGEFLDTGNEKTPLDRWHEFELEEIPNLYPALESACRERIPVPPAGLVSAPRKSELLLTTTIGTRELILLPTS